ncbi:hypothetical protein [Candidatus Palauibacter sp.]|uniref:hypothetical protein n=1 Tax=Candidatus Palauibacter sp. TaxID=3101350 RepID=UPI003AF2C5A6
MSRLVQRCLTALLVLFVVGGIGFGASQAFGSTRVSGDYCGAYDEDLGCCPSYINTTCWEECTDLGYYFGGGCLNMGAKDKNGCQHCCSCLW